MKNSHVYILMKTGVEDFLCQIKLKSQLESLNNVVAVMSKQLIRIVTVSFIRN